MPEDNTFVDKRQAILLAAAELYQAEQGNMLTDQEIGRVTLLTPVIGEDPNALREAEYEQARLDTAARTIARLAALEDDKDRGGLLGVLARVEIRLTKVMERPYLRDLGAVAAMVEIVRHTSDTLPTVEEQQ